MHINGLLINEKGCGFATPYSFQSNSTIFIKKELELNRRDKQ